MADNSSNASAPFLKLGKEQTEAMLGVQKELLDAYEQTSRAWLARIKSKVDLWSELTSKLSSTRSAAEAAGAYQEWVGQHMKMAVEDGRRISDDCQTFIQKMSRSLANGRPSVGT